MSIFDEMGDAGCSSSIYVKEEPELQVGVVEDPSPACYYCARRFISVSMLRKHIKLRHLVNAEGNHFEFVAVDGDSGQNSLSQQHAGRIQDEAIDKLAESNSVVGDNLVLIKTEPVDMEDESEHKAGEYSAKTLAEPVRPPDSARWSTEINRKKCVCSYCGYATTNSGNLKSHIMAKRVGDNLVLIKEEPIDNGNELEPSQNSGAWDNLPSIKDEQLDTDSNEFQLLPNSGGNSEEQVFKSFRPPGRQESTHSKRKRRFCPFCDYSASNVGHLKSHIMVQHMKEKPHLCTYCDYRTAWGNDLRRHIFARHTNRKQYSCTFCKYKTVLRRFLTAHIKKKHPKKNPYVCAYHKVTSAQGSASNTHNMKKTHACQCGSSKAHTTPEDSEALYCAYCDFHTTQRASLKTHILSKHADESPYSDSTPPESSNVKTYVTPKQADKKLHWCTHCDCKTARSEILQTHIAARHSSEKQTPARSKMSSAQTGSLHAWVKLKLTKKKRYWCKYCEFSASKGETLRDHVMTNHRNERPRAPTYPDLRSTQSGNLKTESSNPKTFVTNKRAKKKRYACRYCEFSAAKCESLKVHIMEEHDNDERRRNANSESCTETELKNEKKYSWSESSGTHFVDQDSNGKPDPSVLVFKTVESRKFKTYLTAEQTNKKEFPCSQCVGVSQCECLETRFVDRDTNEDPVFTPTVSRNPKTYTTSKDTNTKLYPCIYCEFSTTHSASLKTHVIASHTDEKPYSTTQAGALKTYVTPNRSTKCYFCAQCKFKTAQSAVLQAHIAAKHSNGNQ